MANQTLIKIKRKVVPFLLCLFMLLSLFVPLTSYAKEQEQKVVRVGWYDSLFNHFENDGSRSGYAYEYQQKIAAHTGWKYEYVEGSWFELIQMLQNGEIDLLTDVSYTEERAKTMLYSDLPMGTENYYICVAEGNNSISPQDLSALNGKKIGVSGGSVQSALVKDWMKKKGLSIDIVEDDKGEAESWQLVLDGQLDGYVCVNTSSIDATVISKIGGSDFYFVMPNDREKLMAELNSALDAIQSENRYYNQQLWEKYFGKQGVSQYLSKGEVNWLNKHGTIRVGYRDNYLPFCGTDEETGEASGMLRDYLSEASTLFKNAEISFQLIAYPNTKSAEDALKNGEVDCVFPVNMAISTAEEEGFLVSNTVVESPMDLIVSKENYSNIDLKGNVRIALNEGNTGYLRIFNEYFPNCEIVYYKSTKDGFKGVASGEADGILINKYQIANMSEYMDAYQLILMDTDAISEVSFLMNAGDTELYSIMSKIRSLIPDASVQYGIIKNTKMDTSTTLADFIRANLLQVFTVCALIAAILLFLLFRSMKAEKAAKIAEERTAKANAAKTSFLFNMSHDIRTPMNAIMGFRELLEKYQEDPDKRKDYLKKIEDSSNVLLSIINNVLEMARIEKGEIEIEETVWSAEQFNDTLYIIFDEMMKKKGISFTRTIDVQHHYVFCDPIKVREIFFNILSNAYKYTEPGGSVSMKLEEIPSDKDGYALYRTTITDTGIGISEDFLPHIFEEFAREKTTTENRIEGTGLGLPIVKRLVELMDGTIEVSSTKGKGTTFITTIPHRIAEQSALSERREVEIDPKFFENRRILLAEDNDLNAEITAETLSDFGFIVDRAEDGMVCCEKLSAAENGFYDIIIMDIQMPNMNGYEATKTIRQMSDSKKASIPIIALTANAFEEDRREALHAGMNGHLSKPIDVTQMMKTLAEVLG